MGRIPQGIEGEDRIAFGLSISRISYLLVVVILGCLTYMRPWPWPVRLPVLALLTGATAEASRVSTKLMGVLVVVYLPNSSS